MAGTGDSEAHWRALHDAGDLQFAPLPPVAPAPPSPWGQWLGRAFEWLHHLLDRLGALLRPLFEPLGHALGLSWPVLRAGLLVVAALLLLALVWRIAAPLRARWRARAARPEAAQDWRPDHGAALALLADADLLAAQGHYGEAVHVLLARSIAQIAKARPEALHPASTAREIAADGWLPPAARHAFVRIAARVEASRFALRTLGAGDWDAARAAYAEFALQRLGDGR